MGIEDRQKFIMKLLTDDDLRRSFYNKTRKFRLSKNDDLLIRMIDEEGIERKATSLKRTMKRLGWLKEGD